VSCVAGELQHPSRCDIMVRRWFRNTERDPYEDEGIEVTLDQSPRPTRWFQKKTLSSEDEDDDDINNNNSNDRNHSGRSNSTRSLFSYWRNNNNAADDTYHTIPTAMATTVVDALYSLMGDEDLSDVRLHGNDGGSVVAVKAILAARSPIFRQKFFGPVSDKHGGTPDTVGTEEDAADSETSIVVHGARGTTDTGLNTTVEQPATFVDGKMKVEFEEWDCRILYLVVEFCYTDNLSIMDVPPNDEIARIMAGLRSASKAFKLLALLDKVDQWGFRNISRYPALCCALIDEGMRRNDIDSVAMKTLQLKTRAALLPVTEGVGSGILALSKSSLMFVLRTLESNTSHMLLFDALQRWVEFSSDALYSNLDPGIEKASKTAFASRCAVRFIKLGKISPGRMDEVMASGLYVKEIVSG